MSNQEKDIKFGCWDMGRFLKHFLIHIVLLIFAGIYIIGVLSGDRLNLLTLSNFISFILAIMAIALSIVSLVITYRQTVQSQQLIDRVSSIETSIRSKTSAPKEDSYHKEKATDTEDIS